MTVYSVPEFITLIIALLTLITGDFLCDRVSFLKKASIPSAVVGGILISILVSLSESFFNIRIDFATRLRDILILLFFVSLGITAKFSSLRTGGKPLLYICIVTVILLVLQNLAGIGVALARGAHPFYGLLAGSVSFVGGPGTAMAWAKEASKLGLNGAELVAISAATFAVSVGAIISGPIVTWIIKRHKLHSEKSSNEIKPVTGDAEIKPAASTSLLIRTLLIMSVAIWLGNQLNAFAIEMKMILPGFLCSLLAGMLITNVADLKKLPMPTDITDRIGDLALQIFLVISLMSLKLSALGTIILPIAVIVILQVLLAASVAYYLLFRLLGKDYDAAVACGGFIGYSVSSMPVAMATMEQITKRYGPSPKAILLITLVGSFFVDLANTFIVKGFVSVLPEITK